MKIYNKKKTLKYCKKNILNYILLCIIPKQNKNMKNTQLNRDKKKRFQRNFQ